MSRLARHPDEQRYRRFRGALALAVVLTASVTWAHGPGHKTAARPVSPEERTAFAAAKPVLDKHCARCHATGGRKAKPKTLKHFNMTKYPPTGHHANEIGPVVRRVLLGDKTRDKAPTMPADDVGAVAGEELKAVISWTEAVDKATPAAETPPAKKPARSGAAHQH
jgi:hypothetical protein